MFDGLSQLEGPFLLWVQDVVRRPWLNPIVSVYTCLGGKGGIIWICLSLLLLFFPKTRKAGAAGCLALMFSGLFTNALLKPIFSRTRPWLILEGLTKLVEERDLNSFPSGHSSAAFAAAVALMGTLEKRWVKVLVLFAAILFALSRLYVGVHFPSDVLCGVLVGSFCGYLACCVVRAWEKRKKQEPCLGNKEV